MNRYPQADQPPAWKTVTFPTNPLTPGPRPRDHAGLLHTTTGYGRNHLLYFLGDLQNPENAAEVASGKEAGKPTQWSDMRILQSPFSDIKPAKVKDWIRSKFNKDFTHT